MLQDRYVKAWAENSMMTANVSYGSARVDPVVDEGWAMVAHLCDPSGVLLHFAELM